MNPSQSARHAYLCTRSDPRCSTILNSDASGTVVNAPVAAETADEETVEVTDTELHPLFVDEEPDF